MHGVRDVIPHVRRKTIGSNLINNNQRDTVVQRVPGEPVTGGGRADDTGVKSCLSAQQRIGLINVTHFKMSPALWLSPAL